VLLYLRLTVALQGVLRPDGELDVAPLAIFRYLEEVTDEKE